MYNANIKDMKKSIFFIFFIGLVSLFYGCGNSNSHSKKNISHEQNISEYISPEYNISGIIQKGNFINGILTAQRVEVNGSTFGEVVSVSIDKDARYKITLPWKRLTLLSAKGKFFNEYTGTKSTEDAQLYALVDSGDTLSSEININLFTSLETYRVIELMRVLTCKKTKYMRGPGGAWWMRMRRRLDFHESAPFLRIGSSPGSKQTT